MDKRAMPGKKLYLEILRIIALFLVIFNHTGSYGFLTYMDTENPVLYNLLMVPSILCKMGVPLFFMVSGAVLLGKEEGLGDFYRKRVLRIVIVLVFFSAFWYLYLNRGFSLAGFLASLYQEEIIVSYWYLYSYLAFLVAAPLLGKLARAMSHRDFWYLLALWAVFCAGVNVIRHLTGMWMDTDLDCALLAQNLFFPMMGYYFANRLERVRGRQLCLSGVAAGLCLAVTVIFTVRDIQASGDPYGQEWFSTFIAMPAFFLFLLAKRFGQRIKPEGLMGRCILTVGSCTFGVYLTERALRGALLPPICDFLTPFIGNFLACLVAVAAVVAVGTVMVWGLKRVPVLGKLL